MFQRAVIQITAMLASLMLMQGCQLTESDTAQPSATNKPNVLWIYLEDLDPVFSPYGDPINTKEYTPTIQSMADQGVVFRTAFAPAPVCSPSRSAVITGTMPTTFGVQNHHSSRTMEDAIFLPKGVKTIPEIMREAGYATFNHGKDDYNFVYNRKDLYEDDIMIDFWYTFAGEGDWLKIAKQGKPFFGQIQTMGGKWSLDSIYPKTLTAITPVDRNAVVVPPYYPATKEVIEYSARRYDAARYTDVEVKQILDTLRTNGLLNNTYVFFFTDHGYNDSRHKQFVYDGGIQVPLIVTYFGENGQIEKGSVRNDLVSTLDLGTTTLALAGLEIPDYMEGMDLFASDYKRDQIISTRDRCDFTIDRIRAVRTEDFKYIKNYFPERSMMQPSYRDRRPDFLSIQKLYEAGKLNEVQSRLPAPTKPAEELYNVKNDPFEINNLATDPMYAAKLEEMRQRLATWQETTGDKGSEPQHLESLRFMMDRWGDRCVNPEYDAVRNSKRHNQPASSLKK